MQMSNHYLRYHDFNITINGVKQILNNHSNLKKTIVKIQVLNHKHFGHIVRSRGQVVCSHGTPMSHVVTLNVLINNA